MGILVTSGDSFTYGDELPGSRQGYDEEKGDYLPDTHHHLTFTHKLANRLGVEYVNLGANGSSNQKIFRRTMDFLQRTSKKIDYMVVTWSSWGRVEVCSPMHFFSDKTAYIQRECNMNQIIPNHYSGQLRFNVPYGGNDEHEKRCVDAANQWFEHVYNPQTAILHTLSYMRTVQFICDTMGIKVIQGIIHNKLWLDVLQTLRHASLNEPLMKGYVEYLEESFAYIRPECQWGFFDNRKDMISIAEDNEGFEIYKLGHVCEKTHEKYAENLYDTFTEMNNASD